MYGHKQIIQCLGIILMITILNFYRKVIVQNREMMKMKAKLRSDSISREIRKDVVSVINDVVHYPKRHSIESSSSINNNSCDGDVHKNSFDRLELCLKQEDGSDECYQKSIANGQFKDASKVNSIFGSTSDGICANNDVLSENFVCKNTTSSVLEMITSSMDDVGNTTFVGN